MYSSRIYSVVILHRQFVNISVAELPLFLGGSSSGESEVPEPTPTKLGRLRLQAKKAAPAPCTKISRFMLFKKLIINTSPFLDHIYLYKLPLSYVWHRNKAFLFCLPKGAAGAAFKKIGSGSGAALKVAASGGSATLVIMCHALWLFVFHSNWIGNLFLVIAIQSYVVQFCTVICLSVLRCLVLYLFSFLLFIDIIFLPVFWFSWLVQLTPVLS